MSRENISSLMKFWNRFYTECQKNNISPSKLAAELNISQPTMTGWKKGSPPNSERLLQVAEYFNVSIDYLLERDIDPKTSDPEEELLLKRYRSSDRVGKDRIQYTAETEERRSAQEGNVKSSAS